MPTASGMGAIASVALAWLGSCSPVSGVASGTTAGSNALRCIGARPAAWRFCCFGVEKQPVASDSIWAVASDVVTWSAPDVVQSIVQVPASMSGSSPEQGAPTVPIFLTVFLPNLIPAGRVTGGELNSPVSGPPWATVHV